MTTAPPAAASTSPDERVRATGGVVTLLSGPRSDQETIVTRLSWLLFFRTVVITVLLFATVGLRAGSGQPLFGTASLVLYVVCGVSYASILGGALWIRKHNERNVVALTYLQLMGDSAVATVLVVATGGYESAFVFLYSLTILNAAAVLDRTAALLLASVNSALFMTLIAGQVLGWLELLALPRQAWLVVFPSLLANVLSFFLVAFLSSSLTDQLRRTAASLDEARERVVQVEAEHEQVLESLPSGVLTVDDQGIVRLVNAAGQSILGRDEEALIGVPVAEVLPELALDGRDVRFEIILEDARVLGGSVADLRAEGQAGRVVVFQDLTELRHLQEELSRADRLQTIGRFASGMAHELRNPLQAMVGCLQLLRTDLERSQAGADESERLLSIVEREANRLSTLVTDFLTYARPPPPRLTRLDLREVVRHTVEAATSGEPEVVVELDLEAEPVVVRGDADQIERVVWNLLGNALQAVNGDIRADNLVPHERWIAVSVRQVETFGVLVVSDGGPGIPDDERPQIFEPFFTTRPGGTGLGLATSHQIITTQGGEIVVGSSMRGGAEFTVRLPLAGKRGDVVTPFDGVSLTRLRAATADESAASTSRSDQSPEVRGG